MIYQVRYYYGKACNGYEYFSSKKEALKRIKEYTYIVPDEEMTALHYNENHDQEAELWDSFKTPKTKKEILWALNFYGGHPENG